MTLLSMLLLYHTKSIAQTNPSLQFAGHLPMAAYGGFDGSYQIICNDVEGYVAPNGTEYAVVGTHTGIAIVDVSNAAAPNQVAYIAGGVGTTWREIAIYSHYAYCVTDGREALGILIIDLANLPASTSSQYWIPQLPNAFGNPYNLTKSHTIVIEDGFMYLNGYNALEQQTAFFDLRTSPTAPTYAGMVNDEYCHDSFIRHDTLYTANIYSGQVRMYNVANKANPQEIGVPFNTPFNFTHQIWQSNDGNYLFTTDERPDAPVGAYNINDLNNVNEVNQFLRYETIGQGSVSHNLYVVPNDYLVIANYTDGVTIVDVRHPDNMVEIANYDTYPGATPSPPYSGVWAVYPYLPSGKLLVSDMASGFYTLTPNYQRASWLQGVITDGVCGGVINDAKVTIQSNNTGIAGTNSKVTGMYKTGYKNAGTYTLLIEKAGYTPISMPVTLVQGQITVQNITLMPVGIANVTTTVNNASSQAVIQSQVKLTNPTTTYNGTTDASGQVSLSCVLAGNYDLWAGKWGYQTAQTPNIAILSTTNTLPTSTLNPGYTDPFELDLGWTENAAGNNTVRWQREELTTFGSLTAADAGDAGKFCYVTHSGGNSVNNGEAVLTSPVMNLTGFTRASLRYDYRYSSPQNSGSIAFYLQTPTQTVLIDSIIGAAAGWRAKIVNISSFVPLGSSVQLIVRVISPQNGATVEAGFDNFVLTTTTSTNTPSAPTLSLKTQPNPFHDNCTLQVENYSHNEKQKAVCMVYNTIGQIIREVPITASGRVEIGDGLAQGTYFVHILIDGQMAAYTKVVKM